MKRVIYIFSFTVIMIAVLNFPLYLYDNFEYYSGNTIKNDIIANAELYKTDTVADIFTRHYGDNMTDLLSVLSKQEYSPCTKSEAFKILSLFDADTDKNSVYTQLPMFFEFDHEFDRLTYIQTFEMNKKKYIFL